MAQSAEKKFAVLCEIARAQHFAWREAVAKEHPEAETTRVVLKMWRVTGQETGRAYLRRLQPQLPLARQVAAGVVWSSECMGEDAVVEGGDSARDEAFVRHRACPWHRWHQRFDLVAEDQPGCDEWFRATCETVGAALGRTIRFETIESLPEGGASCLRRIWVEHP